MDGLRRIYRNLIAGLEVSKMRLLVIFMMGLLLVGGCMSAEQLKEKPGYTTTFEVGMNYQEVYRQLIGPMRSRHQTGEVAVNGDIYTDIQEGEIVVMSCDYFGGRNTPLLVEIEAVSDDKTKVSFYAIGTWKQHTKKLVGILK